MFGTRKANTISQNDAFEMAALCQALDAAQAMIWFDVDGTILQVNENFCATMRCTPAEVVGAHHRIFIDPEARDSAEYAQFWDKLRRGETVNGEFERLAGDGTRLVLSAFYNPVRDAKGEITKFVKFAMDITEKRKTVSELETCLAAVARGDLSQRLGPSRDPEFADLSMVFNTTFDRLEQMVTAVDDVSQTLAAESAGIANHARDLADRGEVQASTLEETAAALEELSTAVNGTANNAQLAAATAQTASSNANKCSVVVNEAIGAMQDIQNGSNEIGKIIEVIDSISFQTNLLALNAGIEAARAGDAGRGFAVVASEIRALAQRTAEAAKDISELIVASNTSVSNGAHLVDQTCAALTDIGSEIAQVVGNIKEISSATREQAEGITSVTQAASQIDIATQQNASLADQSAQSATKLAEETSRLRHLLAALRGGNAATAPAPGSGPVLLYAS